MDIIFTLFFILFAAVACSWGWGMRGTTIGGEKGAMLPGALLGMAIALFSRSQVLSDNFFVLSGMGAVAMYCGGSMTYGETFNFSMASKPAPNLKKGLIALAVKGGAWFGIFGGAMGMYISVLSGLFYSLADVIVFIVLLPVCALGGYYVFNKPYNKEKQIYPRIYFSMTRKETWGGLWGILLLIAVFTAVKQDWFGLIMAAGGAVSGAVGWVVAQLMQIAARFENKKGKLLFDKINRKGLIGAWKLMECALGAFGGAGIALTVALSQKLFYERTAAIDSSGLHPLVGDKASLVMSFAFAAVIAVDTALYFIKAPPTKAELAKKLELTLISREEYDRDVLTAPDSIPVKLQKLQKAAESCEFALYSTVPMAFMLLGSSKTASLVSFVTLFVVLSQEDCFKNFKYFKKLWLWKTVLFGVPAVVLAVQLLCGKTPGAIATVLLYTFVYEALELVRYFWESSKKYPELSGFDRLKKHGDGILTHIYFIVCCTALVIAVACMKYIII